MRSVNKIILGPIADNANHNAPKVDCSQLITGSFHIICTSGTLAGSFKLQASNDPFDTRYLPDDFTPTNWVDIPSSSVSITSGAPAILFLPNMCYRWVRAVWTYTSGGGSGTVTVEMNAMSI